MYNSQFRKYLNDLAAKTPTPGGGSAAAVSCALGTSLLTMVANFSLGKKKSRLINQEIKNVLKESKQISAKLNRLIDDDIKYYKRVRNIRRIMKKKASKRLDAAVKKSVDTSMQICTYSYEAAKLCRLLSEKGNPNLITDTASAILFLESGLVSAGFNIKINLQNIHDKKYALKINRKRLSLTRKIKAVKKTVLNKAGSYI